jgi:aryl-alcohol dehydrogenase-like predicted oxidoreductase
MPKRANSAVKSAPVGAPTLASAAGTKRYATRWESSFVPDFYRTTNVSLTLSSLALGTYLGESDDETDARYIEATRLALQSGVNVIDTAINYRCQRSERVIGRVVRELLETRVIQRDEIVLCTKAGYIPLDGSPPRSREEYNDYLRAEYFDTGLLRPDELVGGGHAITPAFLRDQLRRSLRNLGMEGIDYFYLHNPEQQQSALSPDAFRSRIRDAFEALEQIVAEGTIRAYGCATWSGLRHPSGSQGHLSLYELSSLAKEVAGADNHFKIVQLPVNLTMSEAVRLSTQRDTRGRLVHIIDAAAELGIDLVASAPLLQGQLTRNLPEQVRTLFPGSTDAQRALAFVRSVPSLVTAAVGMKEVRHVEENLASAQLH